MLLICKRDTISIKYVGFLNENKVGKEQYLLKEYAIMGYLIM